MKKKIFKYIKIFVSVALIAGLIAPSYAALSASDGSAFVTKAEFDSALADFNSRLTTFEAGINSKIDSQVTSYLDRNGIWSGKEQIINSLFEDTDCGFKSNTTTSNQTRALKIYVGSDVKLGVEQGNSNYSLIANNNGYQNKKLIEKLNKSGLLFLYYDTHKQKRVDGADLGDEDVLQIVRTWSDTTTYGAWPESIGIAPDISYWFAQEENVALTNGLSSFKLGEVDFEAFFLNRHEYNNCVMMFVNASSPLYVNKTSQCIANHVVWSRAGKLAVSGELSFWCDFRKATIY